MAILDDDDSLVEERGIYGKSRQVFLVADKDGTRRVAGQKRRSAHRGSRIIVAYQATQKPDRWLDRPGSLR